MANSVRSNVSEFGKMFSAFKNSTTAFADESNVNQMLLRNLQKKGLVLEGNEPIKVADICCGSAEKIIEFFNNINFSPGFDIRATDLNAQGHSMQSHDKAADSVDAHKFKSFGSGTADQNLMKAMNSQIIPLRKYSVKGGDAFKDNLLDLLSTESDAATENNTFSLVYAMHCFYYWFIHSYGPSDEVIKQFLDGIFNNLLSDTGIAVFGHVVARPKSWIWLKYKYSCKVEDPKLIANDYQSISPDYLVESYCDMYGLSHFSVHYTPLLKFHDNVLKYRNIFKDPTRYDELRNNSEALDDLCKLLFIAARSPKDDLYSDISGLACMMDDVLDMLQENKYLCIPCILHVIPGRKTSNEFKKAIGEILQDMQATIDQ